MVGGEVGGGGDGRQSSTRPDRPSFLLPPLLSPLPPQYVEREIVNHSNFCHPHVIQFKEARGGEGRGRARPPRRPHTLTHPTLPAPRQAFLTPTHLGIAMEYAPGGDLFAHVSSRGGLPEGDARFFFQQLVMGLDYCHRMGVVNRDVKLENTLLDGSTPRPLVKICDWGYSKNDEDSRAKTKVGTPGYTAPEVVRAGGGAAYDGRAADVWSAGVMLFTMVACAYPFERAGDGVDTGGGFGPVLDRILRVDYEWPAGKAVSDGLKDLVSKILVADPRARATLADVVAHPWFAVGLPPEALSMNDACLALRPHAHPGYQTVDAVRAVVRDAARAAAAAADADDAIIEDVLGDEDGLEGRPSAFLEPE